jgi:hypothetical protein
VGADGSVYVADHEAATIQRFALDTRTACAVSLRLDGLRSGAVRRGSWLTARGVVTPATMAGRTVKLTVQRKRGAAWVKTKIASRPIRSGGVYSWKFRLGTRGAYRVRAQVAATSSNLAGTSAWRGFTVR